MTQLALEEFVTRTVLGLVSAMWERDLAAEPAKIWHVPHVARSIIKLQSVNHISYQRHLRFLIVTHALHFALKHIGKYNRGDLVPALLAMRGIEPFKQIREILADDGLLIMSPSVEQEVKALKRLEQIRELTIQGGASQDQVRLAQNAALREIDQVSADDFERRLCGVFPELDPRASNN
jgi:ATP phosphoribosyltransferase regulatory subunit HisZ